MTQQLIPLTREQAENAYQPFIAHYRGTEWQIDSVVNVNDRGILLGVCDALDYTITLDLNETFVAPDAFHNGRITRIPDSMFDPVVEMFEEAEEFGIEFDQTRDGLRHTLADFLALCNAAEDMVNDVAADCVRRYVESAIDPSDMPRHIKSIALQYETAYIPDDEQPEQVESLWDNVRVSSKNVRLSH
jgi:hypothetical protein